MNFIKRFAAVTASAVLTVCAALPVLAAPAVDRTTCVMDNANILSSDTEIYITNITRALQQECGAEIGVYTVEYIGNSTMEGYAYEVFNAWGLGDADKDNGVLFLMSPGEDNYWITRGSGVEKQLSVSTLNDIFDTVTEDNWVSGNFDACAQKTVASVAEKLCRQYGITMDVDAVGRGAAAGNGPQAASKDGSAAGMLLIVFAILLVILLIIWLSNRKRRGPPPPPSAGGSGGGFANNLFWYSMGRSSVRRPRRPPPPPPPPPRGGPGPRPGSFGGPGPMGGGFHTGGGSSRGGGVGRSGGSFGGGSFGGSRPSGGFRSSGGSFRTGGGSTRGGGAGRR